MYLSYSRKADGKGGTSYFSPPFEQLLPYSRCANPLLLTDCGGCSIQP